MSRLILYQKASRLNSSFHIRPIFINYKTYLTITIIQFVHLIQISHVWQVEYTYQDGHLNTLIFLAMCTMYITRHWLVLLRDQKVAHLRDRYTCNVIGKHCFMEYWPHLVELGSHL